MNTPNKYAAGFPSPARSTNSLPSIPVDPDLHRRLAVAAAEHTPLIGDVRERLWLLVEPTLRALVERLEAGDVHHRPTKFCFCGGSRCSPRPVPVDAIAELVIDRSTPPTVTPCGSGFSVGYVADVIPLAQPAAGVTPAIAPVEVYEWNPATGAHHPRCLCDGGVACKERSR